MAETPHDKQQRRIGQVCRHHARLNHRHHGAHRLRKRRVELHAIRLVLRFVLRNRRIRFDVDRIRARQVGLHGSDLFFRQFHARLLHDLFGLEMLRDQFGHQPEHGAVVVRYLAHLVRQPHIRPLAFQLLRRRRLAGLRCTAHNVTDTGDFVQFNLLALAFGA